AGELVMAHGGKATLDFSAGLPAGVKIRKADVSLNGRTGGGPSVNLMGDAVVLVSSRPRVAATGTAEDEVYTLNLVLEAAEPEVRSCPMRFTTLSSYLVPYGEASLQAALNATFVEQPPQPAP